MMNLKQLGVRINEKRKSQGLTQEQLGNAVGVSAQAVSKWENGECAPDLLILPELCKVLAVSSDTLMGIESDIGIENLGRQLSEKYRKAKLEDKMKILSYMHMYNAHPYSKDTAFNRGSNIAYDICGEKLDAVHFWAAKGIAVFIQSGLLDSDATNEDAVDIIRTIMHPTCWEITVLLLKGPSRSSELKSKIQDEGKNIDEAINMLIDKGIIILDRKGYRLDEQYRLYLAGLMKAVSSTLLGKQSSGRGISTNRRPT